MNINSRFNENDKIVFRTFNLIDPYHIDYKGRKNQEFEILKKVEEEILDYLNETFKKTPFKDFVNELKKNIG